MNIKHDLLKPGSYVCQGDAKPWGKGACFPCAPEAMITKKVKKELLKKKIKYGELGNVKRLKNLNGFDSNDTLSEQVCKLNPDLI